MENIPEKVGKYKPEEIELSLQINAEGKIQLLGSGIGIGSSGGIRIRMIRID